MLTLRLEPIPCWKRSKAGKSQIITARPALSVTLLPDPSRAALDFWRIATSVRSPNYGVFVTISRFQFKLN